MVGLQSLISLLPKTGIPSLRGAPGQGRVIFLIN